MKRLIIGVLIGIVTATAVTTYSDNDAPKEMPAFIVLAGGGGFTIEERRVLENLVQQINDRDRILFEAIR